MFEREEREVVETPVRFQVIDEAAEPGNLSVGIGPDFDVTECSFKGRASQLRLGDELVNRGGELYVQRAVIFRQHVLSVGLFAHLDIGDWIMPLVQIGDFVRSVFGRGVEHGDRNHRRQTAGDAAIEEEIESHLIAAGLVEIGGGVSRDRPTMAR